jgi:predicted enzyme related to lactoylglutathione lyase
MSDTPTGRFCWYELMTTDPGAAPSFYGDVVGWGTQGWDGGGMPYTMWMNGEAAVGGIMQLPEEAIAGGAPPHWLIYISTADVASTTEKATELGATVLMGPMDIPEVGIISVIADPQGAVFCAYQPATGTPGHDGPPAMGEFSWHELATNDWEAAWGFYATLFDWQLDHDMDMGPMGINRPPEMPVCAWMPYARVADVDAACAKVTELGGQVLSGPMEVPGGDMVAQCMDPQGAAFAIHSLANAAA